MDYLLKKKDGEIVFQGAPSECLAVMQDRIALLWAEENILDPNGERFDLEIVPKSPVKGKLPDRTGHLDRAAPVLFSSTK